LYQVHEEIYNDHRCKAGKDGEEETDTERIGIIKALTHVDYRSASWMVFYIMLAFNLSGIPIINIYTPEIFKSIKQQGGVSAFTPYQQSTFIGVSNFVGALLSNFTIFKFKKR
jgi:hypothetical protein